MFKSIIAFYGEIKISQMYNLLMFSDIFSKIMIQKYFFIQNFIN